MSASSPAPTTRFASSIVIVHGGVDMHLDPVSEATMIAAVSDGYRTLADPLAAAALTVGHLERDPSFNAGIGSVLNIRGDVEVDAAIIDGSNGNFGAVGAAPDITSPVLVALEVLRRRDGVLISGLGARQMAEEIGVECRDLRTAEQIDLWQRYCSAAGIGQSRFTGRAVDAAVTGRPISATETVGALIVHDGRVVAASSTGGVVGKAPGRIGDAAVLGAGIWADRRIGVLCSGMGEAMIELQLASQVARRVHDGDDLATAVAWAVDHSARQRAAICAVVAVDADTGTVAAAHNGQAFPVYALDAGGPYRFDPVVIGLPPSAGPPTVSPPASRDEH